MLHSEVELAKYLNTLESLWVEWANLLDRITPGQWTTPTANSEWGVHQTAAHHAQAVIRLAEFSNQPTHLPPDKLSAAEFLGQFNKRPDDAMLVAIAAAREAAETAPAELIRIFREDGPLAIAAARARGQVVVQTDEGRIWISEYVRTRIVEAVVHALDIYIAVGWTPSLPEDGLKAAAHALVEFAPLVDFINVSTGRSNREIFPVFT